ncbi:MAG: LCP family protein [Oscillospiraceae bacterium]|nr:LCP family protein [Oscillospiraceae bacterium]
MAKNKHRMRWHDRLLMILSVVMICGAALAIGYTSLMNWSPLAEVVSEEAVTDDAGVPGQPVSKPAQHTASIDNSIKNTGEAGEKTVNFLITGIDYTTTDLMAGTGRAKLTDVIMVVQLNMEDNTASVLQIPRDTWVGTGASSTGKINAVYGRSGLEGLAQVIYDQLSIPLDHYVNMNMDGFMNIVDAVGGVEINVQESFTLEGVTFRPGLQTLNGLQAEKFVRERHNRSGGDIGRLKAQRQFMASLFKKFKNISMGEITKLVPILMKEVTTDLKVGTVLDLVGEVLELNPDNISFFTLPGEGAWASNGQSVWTIHKDVAADTLNENFRPFSKEIPAEDLKMQELRNSTDYYDNDSNTITDLLG